jgi:hypothetical protein
LVSLLAYRIRCTSVPQVGQGWPCRPWTAKSGRNAVTSLGKPSPVASRSRATQAQDRLRRGVQRRHLGVVEVAGAADGREVGGVQDLVAERVADAGEAARVGQRALDRAVLDRQPLPEGREVGLERLDTAPVVLGERGLAAHHVQRRAPGRAGLRDHERATRLGRSPGAETSNAASPMRPGSLPP